MESSELPMIPLASPEMGGREAQYLNQCVIDNFVSSVGPFVDRFEESLAAHSSAKAGVSTCSGTAGLHLALVAIGVKYGDLVLCPSFTFIATANAISHAGATPWLVDISADSWTMDAGQVAHLLESQTTRRDGVLVHRDTGQRVAALMPVHTLGTSADMAPLNELAKTYGLPIVADAACAIGVTYKDAPITSTADLSVFSFNGNKTITSGGGGMVVGNDETLMKHVRHLCTTARVGRNYDHDVVGYNYRMTNLQAAVGLAQLERVDHFIEAKRRIRARYEAAFADCDFLCQFPAPAWASSTCWLSGVVVSPASPFGPGDLMDALRLARIDARPFWKPVHLQKPYVRAPAGTMGVTASVWDRVVTLPSSTGLDAASQDRVISCVLALAERTTRG